MVVGLDISLLLLTPHPFPPTRPLQNSSPSSAGHVARFHVALEAPVRRWLRRSLLHALLHRAASLALARCDSSPRCTPRTTGPSVTFSVHWLLNRASDNICDCTAFLQTAVLLLLQLFFDHRRRSGTGLPNEISMIATVSVNTSARSCPRPPETVPASQEHVDSGTTDGALEQVSHVT